MTTRKLTGNAAFNAYERVKSECKSLIRKLHAEQLTHAEYLELRTTRIFQHRDWARLPQWRQAALGYYLEGALELIWQTQIEWCHWVDGRFVTPDDVKIDYSTLETVKSRHVWKGSRKVFGGT